MDIQWYPGHMTRARKLIAEAIPGKDVLIEVRDGRMPLASRNPLFAELGENKARLVVLTKSDLADPEVTRAWVERLGQGDSPSSPLRVVALSTSQRGDMRRLVPELCRQLAPHKAASKRPLRAILLGIPNVGKSTLINVLQGRTVAKAEDRPGVTKSEQKVELADGSVISDVPGLLWPRIDDARVGLCLALCGTIPDTAIDHEWVALFALELLRERYPDALRGAFRLDDVSGEPAELLEAVGRKRGCLRAGGVVDRAKASGIVLHAFRSGALGRVSLERP